MAEEEKDKKLSKNAEKAKDIASKLSEDMKTAAEAMKRKDRQRNINIAFPTRYAYYQIF
jgi:hypothetical protein